jgi:hypothetical protein
VKIQLQAFWGTQLTQSHTADHLLRLEAKRVVGKHNKTRRFWPHRGGLGHMNLRKAKGAWRINFTVAM